MLEVASGSGQHALFFSRALPGLIWQPSDVDAAARRSIAAWAAEEGPPNLRPPLELDVLRQPWPLASADAVVSINLLHISPPESLPGLVGGASGLLPLGGVLYVYGPFRRPGQPLEPSNQAFDADLRARDARWGLRALDDVEREAGAVGLALEEVIAMPANNLSLVFRKRGA